ncbi:MAG TPA: outer membrane beta-barrel protein [Gemmatimonadales bacterium]|nr:outer membrane beta-barrel protein [Gemmatimonadales bacterium]
MRSSLRITSFAAVLAVVGAAPGRAQVQAVSLFVHGGGYSALKSLNRDGTADFKTGFTLGGGIGFEVDRNVELRVSLTGAQSHFLRDGAETGAYLNRYYFTGALKGQYPFAGGLTPYGTVGGGVVVLHEKGTTAGNRTRGFAHLGVGLAYAVRKDLSCFVQGDGFFYSLSELTGGALGAFTRSQADVAWSVGVAYKFSLSVPSGP